MFQEEEEEEEENPPSYLIHSDVFPLDDDRENGSFQQHTIDFLLPKQSTTHVDEDGDFDIERPERLRFSLVHRSQTSVNECGYQLWNGALLLCDYILTHQDRFVNRTILELGAGLGLCSLLVSRYASRVICTDHDTELLQIIEYNLALNDQMCRKDVVQVLPLDWKEYYSKTITAPIEMILAADVIYDDDLTDLFFNVLMKCFSDHPTLHSIYITIEKRINFYLESQSVESPAYDYFLKKLDAWKTAMPVLVMEQTPSDTQAIPQTTKLYQRTTELILWHIYHSERYS